MLHPPKMLPYQRCCFNPLEQRQERVTPALTPRSNGCPFHPHTQVRGQRPAEAVARSIHTHKCVHPSGAAPEACHNRANAPLKWLPPPSTHTGVGPPTWNSATRASHTESICRPMW
eukprot:356218-Chlamydomonas_euryale.AAC.4